MNPEKVLMILVIISAITAFTALIVSLSNTVTCPDACGRTSAMFPDGAQFNGLSCENLLGQEVKVNVTCPMEEP